MSIVWLNYNSAKIIDVAIRGLEEVASMELPFELIIVDNDSTDGSFEVIMRKVMGMDRVVKVIKLSRNLYYTGGNNIGFLLADKSSRYIAFMNNDLIPDPQSMLKLVSYMDRHPNVGIAQGIIHNMDGSVQTGGFICSELLINYPVTEYPESPYPITYASGAYMIVRRRVLEQLKPPFFWEGLMYFDDWPLGYRVWSLGYKVTCLPIYAGKHFLSGALGLRSPLSMYLGYRGWGALIETTNSRFKSLIRVTALKSLPFSSTRLISYAIRGLHHGIKLGKKLKKKGVVLDIYSAPMLERSAHRVLLELVTPPAILLKLHNMRLQGNSMNDWRPN